MPSPVTSMAFAVAVLGLHGHLLRAHHAARAVRHGQAALDHGDLALPGRDLRVDQLDQPLAHVDHTAALQNAHLGRGQPHAVARRHGLGHVVQQLMKPLVKFIHLPGVLAQHVVPVDDQYDF